MAFGEITERQTHTARQFIENLDGGVSLEMVVIPGGTFLMGSPAGYGYEDERPLHSVRVSSFLMGKYLVTQRVESWVMGLVLPIVAGEQGGLWIEFLGIMPGNSASACGRGRDMGIVCLARQSGNTPAALGPQHHSTLERR